MQHGGCQLTQMKQDMYNTNRFELNPNTGMYEKKGPIYNYQMREMDGKDQRSIIERWGDKKAQEKRMEGNK